MKSPTISLTLNQLIALTAHANLESKLETKIEKQNFEKFQINYLKPISGLAPIKESSSEESLLLGGKPKLLSVTKAATMARGVNESDKYTFTNEC